MTIDHETMAELERLRSSLADLLEHLEKAGASVLDAGTMVPPLLDSVEGLTGPSTTQDIVRTALGTYLGWLQAIERSLELEVGYAALAADEERTAVNEALFRMGLPERFIEP